MEDLAALYEEWGMRLLAYMITLTRNRAAAEDALQNLFVKLATSRAVMRDPAVYLFCAARNEAFRARKSRHERPLEPSDYLVPAPGMNPTIDPQRLAKAISALPPEQSETILLHAVEGLPFRAVAEIVGAPQDTVASRYRYALAKLKEILGNES
jgi:RNA polymerase sigma-70 factor (ECF subfamily)